MRCPAPAVDEDISDGAEKFVFSTEYLTESLPLSGQQSRAAKPLLYYFPTAAVKDGVNSVMFISVSL
jgi:hypothetical protein